VSANRDLSSPVPWRRSLRASRARRASRERRRRLALRGRAGLTLAVVAATVAASGAMAQQAATPTATGAPDNASVRAIQDKLGVKADGVYGPRTRAAVRRFQAAHGLEVDGIVGPQTLAALGLADGASDGQDASAPATGEATSTLERIAQCESGGDPTAVSPDGTYRGKYQFTRETWRDLGGSGDPAQAPETEQDRRAAQLLAQRGTAPWPVCGGA
jgi:peptidoglycan hydrolase-like protein with peptidoglycan-binding domain